MTAFINAAFKSSTRSPGKSRALAAALLLAAFCSSPQSLAAVPVTDASAIPQVGDKAREGYISYLYANRHKAFAIAPGGTWSWRSDAASPAEAEKLALESCQAETRQKCVLYALNDRRVFNDDKWPTLWGPYASREDAATAPVGARVGERFYDITFNDASGTARSISDLRGKVTFVHFWGPWCSPCMREFPELRHFHQRLEERMPGEVALVLLQVRESFEASQRWLAEHDFADVPIVDSGVTCAEQTTLTLADGTDIEDRLIARVFPTTYVLDRNGMVIFTHQGPVADWREYLPFFEHAVQHSGK